MVAEDKRFDVDATPDMEEIDRAQPAADRPNRIPTLSNFQWDTKRMIVAGAVGGSVLFAVLTLAAGVGGSDEVVVAPPRPAAVEVPYDPNTVIAPTLGSAATDPNAPVQLTGEQVPPIGPGGAAGPGTAQAVSRKQTAAEQRREQALAMQDAARRSTLVAYGGANNGLAAQSGYAGEGGEGGRAGGQAQGGATRLDELKRTSAIGRATARMVGDRNYLITAGAIIPCTLQTAMDSSVPGYATCIIPRDVYSDNGRVVLME